MRQSAEQFMGEYEQATDSHDLEKLLSMIDDRAIYLFSDESVHEGKQAIAKVLEHNFTLIKSESYAINNLTWLAKSGEVAACVYDYSWSGVIHGNAVSGFGRGTTVIQHDGSDWKVVNEHLSRGRFAS